MVRTFGQMRPNFTQYILNNYILNPAITGIENYTDVKLSYRNQWAGINGAPVTAYLAVHGPLGKKDYRTTATSFNLPGDNPRGKSYWETYTAPEPHQGAGLIVMSDKTGYISRFSAAATYAYHKGISPKTSISIGFLGGFSQIDLDRSKIEWATLDPNDPAIGYMDAELRIIKPELGAGIWIYSSDYFAGASVLNIVPAKVRFVADNTYGDYYAPQYIASAGWRFFLSDDISSLPSVTAQLVKPFPVQVHFNIKLQYQDRVWIGAGYRFSDVLGGFAAMAGVNVSNIFNISYAYDAATTSRLRYYAKNTNEIMLGFPINNKYGDLCPRNVW